ncbi:helix-turn-helix transcriptional regulator [Nonomuraea sp. NN258]|nr:helix-turn-helix transcriptional regulator [Nonomuraea antri]
MEEEAAQPYGLLTQLTPAAFAERIGLTTSSPERLAFAAGASGGVPGSSVFASGVAGSLARYLDCLRDDATRVLVVDDAHWADPESLRALAHVLRRLPPGRRLLTIVTVRTGHPLPAGFERFLRDEQAVHLPLGGLTASDLRVLSGSAITPRAAERLRLHTDGNPLHARALLGQVPADVLDDPAVPLPAPPHYALPPLSRQAADLLTAAAVLGVECPFALAADLAADVAGDVAAETADPADAFAALDEAVAAGLVTERRTVGSLRIRFADRLAHAAIYQRLGPARRTRLHRRAAELVPEEGARLWHRVQVADRADHRLASDLASHARRLAAGGRWADTAEQLAHAARLTDSPGARDALTAETVDALLADGRVAEAAELSADLARCPDRAIANYARGAVHHAADRLPEALDLLGDAYDHCGPGQERLARRISAHLCLLHLAEGRLEPATTWADRADAPTATATATAATETETGTRAGTDTAPGTVSARAGDPAAEMVAPAAFGTPHLTAPLARAALQVWSDDLVNARTTLTGLLDRADRLSTPAEIVTRTVLAQADHRLGHWEAAQSYAEAAAGLADESGHAWLSGWAHATAGAIAAVRGETDRAERHVRVPAAGLLARAHLSWARACLANALGDADAVITALAPWEGTLSPGGKPVTRGRAAALAVVAEPGLLPWADLLADAYTALGRHARARALLERSERAAEARHRHSVLAALARARATLLAAEGDHEGAEERFEAGLRHAGKVEQPFESARLHLAYGSFLRRAGRRTAAAHHLRQAATLLDALGARPYAERCAQELAACGLSRWADPMGLTPQEHAVTRLVATGLTNQQVARELTLSVKTIEYHLSHAYAKLGVTTRSALTALLSRSA